MKFLQDLEILKELEQKGFSSKLLEAQVKKYYLIDEQITAMFENDPRKGHGGTPHILDNSKGIRMKKVCDKLDDRMRNLFKSRDEQIEKIEKTCYRIIYKKETLKKQTKQSVKFLEKQPIHEALFKMEKDGICSQWVRNPQYFFMKNYKRVALVTKQGKICISQKYSCEKKDFEEIQKIVKIYI